jgi:chromosome partitioning protein
MLKVAVFNLKGGTAKSTTALNLGAILGAKKKKTLLIDMDGQRTLSFGLRMDGQSPTVLDWLGGEEITPLATESKNLWLIPGDMNMFRVAINSEQYTKSLNGLIGFDVVLIDCPPSLGNASVNAILNSDRVLLPTLCEPASLKGLSEAISLIRSESDIPIEVLRSRYKPRLVLTREADDLLIESAEDLNYRLLHSSIPENIQVAESIAQQKPVSEYAPESSGSLAFKSLGKEVSKLWGLRS